MGGTIEYPGSYIGITQVYVRYNSSIAQDVPFLEGGDFGDLRYTNYGLRF